MQIAFFGDIHGQVYHLLAAVLTWQERTGRPLDMVIQVGDFGAERLETMIQNRKVFLRHPANDPAEFDFLRVHYAQGELAGRLRAIREQLSQPVYFLSGNHDEVAWLNTQSQGVQGETIPVDAFDLFHYIPDGTILQCGGMKLAIFGSGERPEESNEHAAFTRLLEAKRGEIDVLITHEPPYGISTGFYGQAQRSPLVSKLIEAIQPRYHVAGHLHTMIGPRQYGATTYLGLNKLGHMLKPRQRDPSRTVQPGTMALLDTGSGILEFVTGDWLGEFSQQCEVIVEQLAACLY
ncbi:MAG TPA: metallophosphoesterase [Ktedonobacteraceae bacterium]|nr:metallophosphoesterase [Ktedonobacteraceae bacterium]